MKSESGYPSARPKTCKAYNPYVRNPKKLSPSPETLTTNICLLWFYHYCCACRALVAAGFLWGGGGVCRGWWLHFCGLAGFLGDIKNFGGHVWRYFRCYERPYFLVGVEHQPQSRTLVSSIVVRRRDSDESMNSRTRRNCASRHGFKCGWSFRKGAAAILSLARSPSAARQRNWDPKP